MATMLNTRLLILGASPGGYVAAIRAAGEFARMVACVAGDSALGIRVANPALNLSKTLAWKNGIVTRLTQCVGALLKKNGTRLIHGHATIHPHLTLDEAVQEAALRALGHALHI